MPNGTSIKIDASIMAAIAKEIDNQRSILENGFSSIFQDASALKSFWDGESAATYQTVSKETVDLNNSGSSAKYIVNALREYVTDLNIISAKFDSTDHKLDVQNEALPSDVFGV